MKRGIRKGGLFAVLALVAVLGLSAAAAAAIPSQGVCYNVRNSKLYDKNNVAPAINETVAKMKDGDRLYLQSGNYRFKETIKLAKDKDRLKNCTIVLEGVYTMDGSFDAMLIDEDFLNVEIGTVTSGRTGDDYKTQGKLPGGIKFRQTDYSDFTFGTVSGFDYGLRFSPQKTKTGECYNKFRFGAITHCYAGLNLNTEGTDTGDKSPAWVNENAFYGGKIANVTYGVLAKKGKNQIDEYNNNSFWNIRFEKVTKDAIFCEFSAFNSFIKPVFSEIGGFYLNQKASSKGNTFTIEAKTPISKLAFYSKGDIVKAPLTDASGAVVASELTTTNLKSAASVKKGFTLTNKKDMTAGPGTTNLPLNIGTVNVSSASGAVTLRTDANASFENNSFMLRVTGYGKAIQVNNLAGKITSAGTYKIIYMGGEWRAVKLS